MSRIGKKSIIIPKGVEIKVDGADVAVKGPKGELKREFSSLAVFNIESDKVTVSVKNEGEPNKVIWGLSRALLGNMIKGVSDGFERELEFTGVGFKAQARQADGGQEIELNLGFTNPVIIKAPAGVTFVVEKNIIKVIGIDKEAVGQTSALIRAARPPEPYKGTGIKYKEEIIIRKAGKKAVAGA